MAKYDLTQKELPAHKEPLELPAHKVRAARTRKAAAAAAVPPAASVSTADIDQMNGGFRWGLVAALLGVALVFAGFLFWGKNDSMKDSSSMTAYSAGTGGAPHTLFDAAGYRIVTASPSNEAVIISPVRLAGVMPDAASLDPYAGDAGMDPAALEANIAGDVNAAVGSVAVAPVTSAANSSGSMAVVDPVNKVIYLFNFDSDGIRANAPMNRLAEKAKKEDKDITVVAYTDEKGSAEYNQRLSEERAKAVADYLVAHGVPADHITTIGKGATHAYATDALDRRAVITLN